MFFETWLTLNMISLNHKEILFTDHLGFINQWSYSYGTKYWNGQMFTKLSIWSKSLQIWLVILIYSFSLKPGHSRSSSTLGLGRRSSSNLINPTLTDNLKSLPLSHTKLKKSNNSSLINIYSIVLLLSKPAHHLCSLLQHPIHWNLHQSSLSPLWRFSVSLRESLTFK